MTIYGSIILHTYDFQARVYHLHICSLNTTTIGSQLCHPSLCPPMPWVLPFSPTSLPSHTSLLDIDLMESPADYPRGFLQCPNRLGICPSASVLPVGVHDPIMKCPTICCSLADFMSLSPFFFIPCLFFTFTFLSPPSLLPKYQHSYPYFAVSISKFSISDVITYAISTLHGIDDLVS